MADDMKTTDFVLLFPEYRYMAACIKADIARVAHLNETEKQAVLGQIRQAQLVLINVGLPLCRSLIDKDQPNSLYAYLKAGFVELERLCADFLGEMDSNDAGYPPAPPWYLLLDRLDELERKVKEYGQARPIRVCQACIEERRAA